MVFVCDVMGNGVIDFTRPHEECPWAKCRDNSKVSNGVGTKPYPSWREHSQRGSTNCRFELVQVAERRSDLCTKLMVDMSFMRNVVDWRWFLMSQTYEALRQVNLAN